MDAVTYIKEAMRMCKSSDDNCEHCPAKIEKFCPISLSRTVMNDMHGNEEKAVSIVEQWSKDHLIKTRQSEFLKMFPHADLTRLLPCHVEKDKRPMRCAEYGYLSAICRCDRCRDDYWNEEVSDND